MKIKLKLFAAACAVSALAAIWSVGRVGAAANTRSASPANLAMPAAALAIGVERTDLDVFALNTDRTLQGKITGTEWQNPITGYNIVRTFRNSAGQLLLFTLNGNTGATQTNALNADGSIGSKKFGGGPQKELRCNAAEFVKIGDVTKLITQDSFTGYIRTFPVNDNGAPDLGAMSKTFLSEMEDKNLFSIYESQNSPYQTFTEMIGVNTWTGEVAIYTLNLQKVATPAWTRGWTSIDHLKIGSLTYRLLYKASGDPYKKPGESGDQARRLLIETVAPDGTSQSLYDNPLGSSMGDYSSVRFVQFPALRGGSSYGILFYRRTTRDYSLFEFDPQTGLGNLIDSRQLMDGTLGITPTLAPPYIDVAPYLINGKTCLAFVNADNAKPLGYEQAEQMGWVIQNTLKNSTVGYQFTLAQSGRIFYSRAWGKSLLDSAAAQERDMTSRTQLNIGSVSKMITAMTLLKLVEQGKLNLSDKIAIRIAPGQANSDSWAKETPVRNLLTHTSGISEDLGTVNDANLTVDCQAFFNAPPDPDLDCAMGNGGYNCKRKYNNSNIIAARKVIEQVTGAQTSENIVAQTRALWANSVDLDELTCAVNPNAYYYGPCDGAGNCFNFAGKSWRRNRPYDQSKWSSYCSSGGWYASSRELIEFLGAIRYNKAIKNQTLVDTLLSTNLMDVSGQPGSTALSWEPPWGADSEKLLGKGGDISWDGVGSHAYITRLPNNCDAVIQINSDSAAALSGLLQDAYNNGVLSQTVVDGNGDYTYPVGYDFVTNTAINTTRTTATESEHVVVSRDVSGNLKLRAFRASRLIDASQLELVAEKTATGLWPAMTSDDVALTDGMDFATASLGLAGQLNVIAWNFNGSALTQHASLVGLPAKEVALAKVATAGTLTRVVTAVRNLDHKLQLDVWDCNNVPGLPQFSTMTHKSLLVDQYADIIDIKNLGAVGDFSKPARFVTAYHASGGDLTVKAWQVDPSGQLQLTDTQSFGAATPVSNDDTFPHRVAIDAAGDGVSGFFNGHGFMTTFIAGDGKLQVVTWYVDAAGKITLKDSKSTFGGVTDQAVSATITVVRLADDPNTDSYEGTQVKLIKWAVANDGIITRTWSDQRGILATNVAATGNLVAAFVQSAPAQSLRLFNWAILDPQ